MRSNLCWKHDSIVSISSKFTIDKSLAFLFSNSSIVYLCSSSSSSRFLDLRSGKSLASASAPCLRAFFRHPIGLFKHPIGEAADKSPSLGWSPPCPQVAQRARPPGLSAHVGLGHVSKAEGHSQAFMTQYLADEFKVSGWRWPRSGVVREDRSYVRVRLSLCTELKTGFLSALMALILSVAPLAKLGASPPVAVSTLLFSLPAAL